MLYLVRKSGNGRAHYWNGRDTVCRMASTGGLSMTRYQVSDAPGSRPICSMCASLSEGQLPEPTHFAFLVKRARDSEAWATIFTDRQRAEEYPDRVSPVVPLSLVSGHEQSGGKP